MNETQNFVIELIDGTILGIHNYIMGFDAKNRKHISGCASIDAHLYCNSSTTHVTESTVYDGDENSVISYYPISQIRRIRKKDLSDKRDFHIDEILK